MKILYIIILGLIISNGLFIYEYVRRPAPKTETIFKSDSIYIRDTVNHYIDREIRSSDTVNKWNSKAALLSLDTLTAEGLRLGIRAFCPDTAGRGSISIDYNLPPALLIRDSITTIKTVLIPGADPAFYKRFGFGYFCGLATAAAASYLAIRAFHE